MKAARCAEFEGPASVKIEEVADPVAGAGEVLVKVHASALNRADLLQTMGLYPAPKGVPADIPGMEFAGEVVGTGKRVMGLIGGGAWAEQVAIDERMLMPIPDGLSFEQAAAIPEAFFTAWDAVWLQAGAQTGESVLIHAVASGVGTAGVQLAKAFGVRSIGTARSADKLQKTKALGLDVAILCADGPVFAEQVKAATGGKGVDVALDLVGGDYFGETLESMAQRGRVMVVGLTAGPSAEVSLNAILRARLTIRGTTLRSRTLDEKAELTKRFTAEVLPLFAQGKLAPTIGHTISMSDIASALEQLQRNDSFGKIVLRWQ